MFGANIAERVVTCAKRGGEDERLVPENGKILDTVFETFAAKQPVFCLG